MAVNPTLYKKVNYDADKDFVPLALYAKSPFVLIVNPASASAPQGVHQEGAGQRRQSSDLRDVGRGHRCST